MNLLDLLVGAGHVLDTPGAIARNTLAGENPFQGLFNPEERTTGRGMLESLGVLGENRDGFDWGDVAGFGAELVADPLNLLGGLGLARKLGTRSMVRNSNTASAQMRAMGFMPEEVASLTKAVDRGGKPLRQYHGSNTAFEQFDPIYFDEDALYGPGAYTTNSPDLANSYVDNKPGVVATNRFVESDPEKLQADIQWLIDDSVRRSTATLKDPEAEWLHGILQRDIEELSRPGHAENLTRQLLPMSGKANELDVAEILRSLEHDPSWYKMDEIRTAPNVRMQYIDARNPLDIEASYKVADLGINPKVEDRLVDLYRSQNKHVDPAVRRRVAAQHPAPPLSEFGLSEEMMLKRDEINNLLSRKKVSPTLMASIREAALNPGKYDPGYLESNLVGLRSFLGDEAGRTADVIDVLGMDPKLNEYVRRITEHEDMISDLTAKEMNRLLRGEATVTGQDLYEALTSEFGPRAIMDQSPFDSITHVGGKLRGGEPHRVWIALNPAEQVYKPYLAPRLLDEPRMSPLIAALMGHNTLTGMERAR